METIHFNYKDSEILIKVNRSAKSGWKFIYAYRNGYHIPFYTTSVPNESSTEYIKEIVNTHIKNERTDF